MGLEAWSGPCWPVGRALSEQQRSMMAVFGGGDALTWGTGLGSGLGAIQTAGLGRSDTAFD